MPEVPDLKPGGFRQVAKSFEQPRAQIQPLAGKTPGPPVAPPPAHTTTRTPASPNRIPLVIGVGIVLFGLLGAITAWLAIPRIEDHLQGEALERLDEAGISGATVELDGRTATISGLAGEDAARAEEILDAEWGIRDARIADDDDPQPVEPAETVPPAPDTTVPAEEPEPEPDEPEPEPAPTTTVPVTEPELDLDDELADLEVRFNDAAVFAPGSADLSADAETILDDLVGLLSDFPETTISIEGHTDADGDVVDNLVLSQARSDAVASYLIDNDVEPERLVALGLGANEPVASNDTADGRAQNRRTEFAALR